MLAISTVSNFAIFVLVAYSMIFKTKFESNGKRIAHILLTSVGILCTMVIFGYCIKAYGYTETVFDCSSDK